MFTVAQLHVSFILTQEALTNFICFSGIYKEINVDTDY